MSVIIQGDQLRALLYGIRAKNAAPKTVPQNATLTIFTVSVGRILVTSLQGVVTTVIAGTTPNLKLVATPTTGTANDMCAVLAITSDEAGTQYSLPGGAVATALNVSGAGSGAVSGQSAPMIVAIGTIGMNVSAADATGAIQWTMTYIPLDDGATVVAA